MNSSLNSPPRWMEFLLEHLLPSEDRQTVVGDLREEYTQTIRPRTAYLKAHIWYLRQLLSLTPKCLSERGSMTKALFFTSLVTLLCGTWLAYMEMVLRHAGYQSRIGIDLTIAGVAFATIAVRLLHVRFQIERWLWLGAIALIWIAAQAIVHNERSAHWEGFAVLVSLVLILQGSLMLISLGRSPRQRSRG